MNKVIFTDESGNKTEFAVEAEVRIEGVNFLLVSDGGSREAEALILRETASSDGGEVQYETVGDEAEIRALTPLFEEALGDTELESG